MEQQLRKQVIYILTNNNKIMKIKLNYITVFAALLSVTAQAQVGIGTVVPKATLHVKSESVVHPDIFRLDNMTNTTRFRIDNAGKIFVTPPAINNSMVNLFGIDPVDNSIKLISKASLAGTGITPTGLESIDEGFGPGWRLIGRDPANYGNIGFGAVDFSDANSPSSEFGSGITYSFIGPGFNNTIMDNSGEESSLNNVILGGNENVIRNSPSNNTGHVSIFGGSSNETHITSKNSFLLGDQNKIDINSYGTILGNDNSIGTGTTGVQQIKANIFGNNNVVSENPLFTPTSVFKNVSIIGDYNNISQGTVIGDNNTIGEQTTSYVFGENNTATTPNEIPSFLVGNNLRTQLPNEVVVGCYSENPSESVGGELKDPVFRVGIGFVSDVNGKDGLRVYRDGRVEIRQVPSYDNLSQDIYCKNTDDGTMSLIQANTLTASTGYRINVPPGTVTSAYLNANFGSRAEFTRVYNAGDSTIYTKINGGVWVKNTVTLVP